MEYDNLVFHEHTNKYVFRTYKALLIEGNGIVLTPKTKKAFSSQIVANLEELATIRDTITETPDVAHDTPYVPIDAEMHNAECTDVEMNNVEDNDAGMDEHVRNVIISMIGNVFDSPVDMEF